MGFIRVRQVGGPDHEFDVPEEAVDAEPDVYEVIDPKPVSVSRPATYFVTASPVEVKGKKNAS